RIPDLVGRGEALPDRPVVTDGDAELAGVQPRDDPGPERLERVAVLGAKQRPIGALPLPLTDVVPDAVAEDAIQRFIPRDVPRSLPDDDRELPLGLDRAGTILRHDDVLLRSDE